jgi:flagellar biosynthetic protein FliQ
MDAQAVFTTGQHGLHLLLLVSAPILLVILVVGLVVSIFQAATQINEATLSFVPKIIAAVAVLRSEERRVGKECRRLCRSRWSPYH